MDQLYMMRAFVAAARHRSFTKAGESMGVGSATISKAITRLEAKIQTRLLWRTPQSVSLLEDAKQYYLVCCRLLEEFDGANRRITSKSESESGVLRIAAHPMLVNSTFSRMLTRYRLIEPNVDLLVSVQEGPVNLYDDKFDVALLPPDLIERPGATRRTLSSSSSILVASQRYLNRFGVPAVAFDLSEHFLLLDTKSKWAASDSVDLAVNGEIVSISPHSSIEGDVGLLRSAALAGLGIAILPESLVCEDIAGGELMRVLPNHSSVDGGATLCAFYLQQGLLPIRVQTFIDFCVGFFNPMSPSELENTHKMF